MSPMTWYLVAWVSWTCPGGMLSGIWPAAARPLICAPHAEDMLCSRRADAERKVRELGPGAGVRLFAFRGLRGREIDLTWSTKLEIGE